MISCFQWIEAKLPFSFLIFSAELDVVACEAFLVLAAADAIVVVHASISTRSLCEDGFPAALSHLAWAARTDKIKWSHVPTLCDNTQVFLCFAMHFCQ